MAKHNMINVGFPTYAQIRRLQCIGVWNCVLNFQWQLTLFEQNIHVMYDIPSEYQSITIDEVQELINVARRYSEFGQFVNTGIFDKFSLLTDPCYKNNIVSLTEPWARYLQGWSEYCGGLRLNSDYSLSNIIHWARFASSLYSNYLVMIIHSGEWVPYDTFVDNTDGKYIKSGREWVHRDTYTKQIDALDSLVGDIGTWEVATEMVKETHGKQGMWGWKRLTKKYPNGRLGLGNLSWADARLVWDARQKLLCRSI